MFRFLNSLRIKLLWAFLPKGMMLYIPYDECKLCDNVGIYRGKRQFWQIGHVIDYCPSCDQHYGSDVYYDFFDAKLEQGQNPGLPTRKGLPFKVL